MKVVLLIQIIQEIQLNLLNHRNQKQKILLIINTQKDHIYLLIMKIKIKPKVKQESKKNIIAGELVQKLMIQKRKRYREIKTKII